MASYLAAHDPEPEVERQLRQWREFCAESLSQMAALAGLDLEQAIIRWQLQRQGEREATEALGRRLQRRIGPGAVPRRSLVAPAVPSNGRAIDGEWEELS